MLFLKVTAGRTIMQLNNSVMGYPAHKDLPFIFSFKSHVFFNNSYVFNIRQHFQ